MGQTLSYLKPLAVTDEIEYPESDGKPMGETAFHILAMMYLLGALRYFFRNAPDVYVGSDMLMYYEEGEANLFVVPDVFVTKRTRKDERRVWKIWEDGVPSIIFEITSRGTRIQDVANKRGLYRLLGVQEYVLFDPLDEYLKPRVQGFRLQGDEYQRLELNAEGEWFSSELNLLLRPADKLLRAVYPDTDQELPTLDEAVELAEQEAERAKSEAERAKSQAERAQRAEQEVERLRAELERLRQQGKE